MNQYNDLRSAEQSSLDAAKSAFFRSGGQIEPLESFTFKPRPARYEPVISAEEVAKRAFVERVREMSLTMTQAEIVVALGVSPNMVCQTCRSNGIVCKQGRKGRAVGQPNCRPDPVTDARMAERLKALAEIGVTKEQARRQTGIGWHVTERLIATFGIEFKKAGS